MPSQERDIVARVVGELRQVGYAFVEEEVPASPTGSGPRADVVAWATNTEGTFGPVLLVEIKLSFIRDDRTVLAQLASYANAFGTEHNYLFDGSWYKASAHFERLLPVDGPVRVQSPDDVATSFQSDLFRRLVASKIWSSFDRHRDHGVDQPSAILHVLEELSQDDQAATLFRRFGVHAVWSMLDALGPPRRGSGIIHTPKPVARAMARMLGAGDGASVLDPFSGVGTLLWAVLLESEGHNLTAKGVERVVDLSKIASAMARLGGVGNVSFEVGAASTADPADIHTAVIASPPMGRRLREPSPVPWGRETTDGDVVTLLSLTRALPDGGRLVVLLARSLLFRSGPAQALREYLQNEFRIAAVVGLPSQTLFMTAIAPVIVVIERTEPGEALVAELQDDWQHQLSDEGAFLNAYRHHLAPR